MLFRVGFYVRQQGTSQEEGLAPPLLGLDKRGQAPLPELFFSNRGLEHDDRYRMLRQRDNKRASAR